MSHVVVFLCSVSSIKMRSDCSFVNVFKIIFPSVENK